MDSHRVAPSPHAEAVPCRIIDRRTGEVRELWTCRTCGGTSGGPTCRRRSCPKGQVRWGLDVWTVLSAALMRIKHVRLVVLTAPGADVLPWDRSRCAHSPAEPCSGPKGCRVDRAAAERYERAAADNWRLLRTAAVTALNRRGFSSPLIALVVEDQRRGVPHWNIVMEEGPAAAALHEILTGLAPRYGFGYIDRQRQVRSGAVAASYLSGYLTSKDGKKADASMQSVAARWKARRRVWWVTPRLTKQTHVTMTALRHGRRWLAATNGLCAMPTEGIAIVDWEAIDLSTGAVLNQVWTREGVNA